MRRRKTLGAQPHNLIPVAFGPQDAFHKMGTAPLLLGKPLIPIDPIWCPSGWVAGRFYSPYYAEEVFFYRARLRLAPIPLGPGAQR